MKILEDYIIGIKVSGHSRFKLSVHDPNYAWNKKKEVCKLIEDTNLFKYYGKSSIDGDNIYYLTKPTLRSIKIDKITKDLDLIGKLETLMDTIKDDIEYMEKLI